MKPRKFVLIGILVAAVALVSGVAWAMSSVSYAIHWDVIAGGGGRCTSANYALGGSIGQPAVGALSSASYRLGAGYWYGVEAPAPPPPPGYKIYLPIVLKNYP